MPASKSRLDRYLSRVTGVKRSDVRWLLAQRRVVVDGHFATDIAQLIDRFSHITFDGRCLQAQRPLYVMLNKPTGVLSATRDVAHTTVIDILQHDERGQLHISGRLDFNSTGLLLLSNDGDWSRQLSLPTRQIKKVYTVTLAQPLNEDYVAAFAQGMYLAYENITTRPAHLKIVSAHVAEVSLCEGRYHQIKRMFGRFQNEVLALHRHRIGSLELDLRLAPGESRELTQVELAALARC